MDKFLEIFQFSTAVPFGYVIVFGACLVVALVCLLAVGSAVLQGKFLGVRFLGGGLVLSLIALFFVANFILSAQLDMNPQFEDGEVVGHWRDGKSELTFNADHTVRFAFGDDYKGRQPVLRGQGTWRKKDDFEIEITPGAWLSPMQPPLRAIKSGKTLRLIVEDFDDPDEWDHHLGFRREPPSQP